MNVDRRMFHLRSTDWDGGVRSCAPTGCRPRIEKKS